MLKAENVIKNTPSKLHIWKQSIYKNTPSKHSFTPSLVLVKRSVCHESVFCFS